MNIYDQLHSKHMSVKDICDYINFVEDKSLPADEYEYIVPYVNKDNFLEIIQKINIPDVYGKLFMYLHYEIVSLYDKFNEYEEAWLSRKENFEWASSNDHEILTKYILDKHYCNYYRINSVICDDSFKYSNGRSRHISLLFMNINNNEKVNINLDVFKYVLDKLPEYIDNIYIGSNKSKEYLDIMYQVILNSIYSKTNNEDIMHCMRESYKCKYITLTDALVSLKILPDTTKLEEISLSE